MPTDYAYVLNLYDNEDTEICLVSFDTVGEMDEYISTIFEDGQQNDCYYKLTDWIGNWKIGRFTTREKFWSDWVDDFYFEEENHLLRLDKIEPSAEGGKLN